MKDYSWRTRISFLRKRFPVVTPVIIRRRQPKKDCGSTLFNGREYHITIDGSMPTYAQYDALMHEWAHVQAIEQAYRHEGPWGVLYAAIHEGYHEHFQG